MTTELQRFHQWAKEHGVRSRVVAQESLGKGTGLFLSLAEKHILAVEQAVAAAAAADADAATTPSSDTTVDPLLFVPSPLLLSKSRVFALTECEPLQRTLKMLGSYDEVTERMSLLLFLIYGRLAVRERNRKEALRYARMAAKADALAKARENGATIESTVDDHDDHEEEEEGEEDWIKPSGFEPYVAVLPDISTPVTLTPEVVQGYLAGTLLLDSVCAKRKRLEAEYENLSGARGIFEHWKVHPTLEDYIWADATFWSRVLSFQSQRDFEGTEEAGKVANGSTKSEGKKKDDMHMAPFLDFANHATKPNIRWHVDDAGLYVLPFDNDEEDGEVDPHLVDNVCRSVPVNVPVKGHSDKPTLHELKETHQELFLSYGDKPNMELLFLYGFMLSNNPVQLQTLAMPMDEEDPYYMPKAHTLMRMHLLPRVTIYLDTHQAPPDVVELHPGLWITEASRDLLWIYALNEEDGLGAELEEPELKICKIHESVDEGDDEMEEADLDDEDELGCLYLTINGQKMETRQQLHEVLPTLEIYPVLVLRIMVMLGQRLEFYIARITESGDKVTKTEGGEIVHAIRYDAPLTNPGTPDLPTGGNVSGAASSERLSPEQTPAVNPAFGKIRMEAASRLGYTIGGGRDSPGHHHHIGHVAVRPCTVDTTTIEQHQDDEADPMIHHQLEVEAQVSTLVQIMKEYRNEELQMLIQMSDKVGEAQVQYLENNTAVQEYLAKMQAEDAVDEHQDTQEADLTAI
ncbi:hypothetical protein BGZ73_003899 [Actinomortierella ambigua]|nr:hypothetical protein BGZ73_003899 [Actinomortierella ambigua]